MDKQVVQRTELQLHTTCSDNISVLNPRMIVREAAQRGMKAIAITNRNSVQCFSGVELFRSMYGNNLKVIYGVELARAPGDELTILAKNQSGLKPLYKLVSGKKIDQKERTNVLIGAHDPSALHKAAQDGASMEVLRQLAVDYDYIELRTRKDTPQDCELNLRLYNLGKELGKPVVAVGNCRYLRPEHKICTTILETLRYHAHCEEDLHLRTTEEMLDGYAYLGDEIAYEIVVTNPNKIADSIEQVCPCKGEFPAFSLPNAEATVRQICEEKMWALYAEQTFIRERLEQELSLLGTNTSLFLLCHKIVNHLQDKGALTGFRGTVGSSLVACLLGFSDANPLPAHYRCPSCKHTELVEAQSGFDLPKKSCPHCGETMIGDGHNIPFETCMGIDGQTTIDIDLNMSENMSPEATRFLADLLGADRLAAASVGVTYTERSAMGCVRAFEKLTGSKMSDADAKCIANLICYVKRGDAFHPGGIMLLPEGMEWEDVTPVRPDNNEFCEIATHLEYHELEGLIPKLDILSFSPYTHIQELFASTGTNPSDIDYQDPKVYELFKNADTYGVPEFSDKFTQGLLKILHTNSFSDLVKVCGMAHSTNVWNGNGEILFRDHPFGELIGTRDDVFLTLRKYDIPQEVAYSVMTDARMGKLHDESADNRELLDFLQYVGVPEWYLESMKKVRYLFTKAHATHYAKLGYMFAWFKAHYTKVFYEVLLQGLLLDPYMDCSDEELKGEQRKLEIWDRETWNAIGFLLEARNLGYAPAVPNSK